MSSRGDWVNDLARDGLTQAELTRILRQEVDRLEASLQGDRGSPRPPLSAAADTPAVSAGKVLIPSPANCASSPTTPHRQGSRVLADYYGLDEAGDPTSPVFHRGRTVR